MRLILPPAADVDAPASTLTSPPLPEALAPTDNNTLPEDTADTPVENLISPDVDAFPVSNTTAPDCAVLAAELISTCPLAPDVLVALKVEILPPVCCELCPAEMLTLPPVVPAPPVTAIFPPLAISAFPA